MKRSGRPVLGALSGLLFGLFVALSLQQWGVWPLDPLTVYGLPILGLLLGVWLGRSAPLRSRSISGSAGAVTQHHDVDQHPPAEQ